MLNGNQNVLRTFSYYPGVDKPHSVMTDTATYYYAVDPTGSVIGLAEYDGTATVVNHYRYDVWGMPQGTETEGVENPIRFKSRWWDPDTKLLDFRSRWYDPEIGRFISEDPIGLAGGINVYTFAGNNPVQGWDPFGLADPTPCARTYGTPTCEIPGLLVNGSRSGSDFSTNFNPSGLIDYLTSGGDGGPRPLGTFRGPGKIAGGGSFGSGGGSTTADTVEVACRPVLGSNSGDPSGGIGHCAIWIHNSSTDLLVQLQPSLSSQGYLSNYFTGSDSGSAEFAAFGAGNFYAVSVPGGMSSLAFDAAVLSSIGSSVAAMAGHPYILADSNRFVGRTLMRTGASVPVGARNWLHTPGL